MTTKCIECGLPQYGDQHSCRVCGGVCVRQEPWRADDESQSTTPLIRSRVPWLAGTWLKVEGANPSGSFKDRVMRTLVAEAVRAGAPGAVVASSGNAAVAASTYAARYRLPLLVIVPDAVPPAIERMVACRGAGLVHVGDGPATAHHIAKVLAERFGLPNLASTFAATGCEWACRGIGHEIADQLGERLASVNTVAAAVSVGPVLLGTAQGFAERNGHVRMVAGQAAGCSPIARAFAEGAEAVTPWTEGVTTRATSIADRLTGYAREATSFLRVLRAGGGAVHAADDGELAQIRADLAYFDGLDVELSSCAALAALRTAGQGGEDAVAVLTGAGLRETLAGQTAPIPARREALEAFLNQVTGGTADVEEVERWISVSES